MMFTVVGGQGFVGSHLVRHLVSAGSECVVPERGEDLTIGELGHVVWCAGLTADFRHRPFDTITAHVSDLVPVLRSGRFASFTYLSSTRVYQHSQSGSEDVPLVVNSNAPGDLYNLSKLTGESLCLASGRTNVRVARLSNVYGLDLNSENFLTDLIRTALGGRLTMKTSAASAKDYVCIDDVVEMVGMIATAGSYAIYNVATGVNVTNKEIVDALARSLQFDVEWSEDAERISFPPIDVSRLQRSFGRQPQRSVLSDLGQLVHSFSERNRS